MPEIKQNCSYIAKGASCELIIETRLSDSTDINQIFCFSFLLYINYISYLLYTKLVCLSTTWPKIYQELDIKSHSDAIELRHRTRHFRLNCWYNVDVLFWKWRCFESNSSLARGVRRLSNSARV